jgi:hypothetical protein
MLNGLHCEVHTGSAVIGISYFHANKRQINVLFEAVSSKIHPSTPYSEACGSVVVKALRY